MDFVFVSQQPTTKDWTGTSNSLPSLLPSYLHRDIYRKLYQIMYLQHRDRDHVLDVLGRLCMCVCHCAVRGTAGKEINMDQA